ncbi:MAG: hypothetical protein ACJAXX_002448 [Roseivirga sp.]|jgi:hypothetical protein
MVVREHRSAIFGLYSNQCKTVKFRLTYYSMWKNIILLFFISFLLFSACTKSDELIPAPDQNRGVAYFYAENNKYREYNVREIRFTAVGLSDTSIYQLREEVRESFINNLGEESRVIYRLTRPNSTINWQLDSVWSVRLERDRAVSVENNIPIVKMVFPVITNRTWDANMYNTQDVDQFKILNFGLVTSLAVNDDLETTRTLTVIQEDDGDGITFRDFRREIYADSIGLISKLYNVVKICSRPECVGLGLIESGRFYRETIVAHGFLDEDEN